MVLTRSSEAGAAVVELEALEDRSSGLVLDKPVVGDELVVAGELVVVFREIISLSASYYNSLDPIDTEATVQNLIEPGFLQMIVLLLSLLNTDDLVEIKEFLESTYGRKSDRRSPELYILKVIPLLSINSKVSLKALWPQQGFKSTAIFNNLQYSGPMRTMNDIPPFELNPMSSLNEVTVVLTDDSKYVVSSEDLEKITCFTPGAFPVQEATPAKRSFDLMIHETSINGDLYKAMQMMNSIVGKVNIWLANPMKSGIKGRFLKKHALKPHFLNEMLGSGRLTKNVALLFQRTLAVAYKVEGHKISRTDAIRNMARDSRLLSGNVNLIDARWGAVDNRIFSQERRELKHALDSIRAQINLADQIRANLGREVDLSDEPVARCLFPEGPNGSTTPIWNDYMAWCHDDTGMLNVEAKQTVVSNVTWLSDEVIELSLHNQPNKIFVTPLKPVPEAIATTKKQASPPQDVLKHPAFHEAENFSECLTVSTQQLKDKAIALSIISTINYSVSPFDAKTPPLFGSNTQHTVMHQAARSKYTSIPSNDAHQDT
ncbi:MAG: hypothetical protein Q9222_004006 [Ikaeria aurantiellina]